MVINLKVKESPITKNGVARIHSNVLNQLGLKTGKNVAISTGNGSILVHIYADSLIEEDMISLRPGDRKKLGVKYGDTVLIKPFSGLNKNTNDIL
jgi:formylmethanofuran dehydrogenase subunit D